MSASVTFHYQTTTHGTTSGSEESQQQPQRQHRDEESDTNPHARLTYLCTDCRPHVCLDGFALVSPGVRHTCVLRPQQAPPSPSPCRTPLGGVFADAPLELLPLVTAVPGAEEDWGQEQDSVTLPFPCLSTRLATPGNAPVEEGSVQRLRPGPSSRLPP